jgi:hypothetical protein
MENKMVGTLSKFLTTTLCFRDAAEALWWDKQASHNPSPHEGHQTIDFFFSFLNAQGPHGTYVVLSIIY